MDVFLRERTVQRMRWRALRCLRSAAHPLTHPVTVTTTCRCFRCSTPRPGSGTVDLGFRGAMLGVHPMDPDQAALPPTARSDRRYSDRPLSFIAAQRFRSEVYVTSEALGACASPSTQRNVAATERCDSVHVWATEQRR